LMYIQQKKLDKSLFIKKDRNGWCVATYQNCFALPRWEFELKEIIDAYLVD
jgi:hypothetical protein